MPRAHLPTRRPTSLRDRLPPKVPRHIRSINDDEFEHVLAHIEALSRLPVSDTLIMLLSVLVGLSAKEIASLWVEDLLDDKGRVSYDARIWRGVRWGRLVPLHPRVRSAVERFREHYPTARYVALDRRWQSDTPSSANAITIWFRRLYRDAGLSGCSSHSGRAKFIAGLSAQAAASEVGLSAVQYIAGHRRLETTLHYIQPHPNTRPLINSQDGKRSREALRRPAYIWR